MKEMIKGVYWCRLIWLKRFWVVLLFSILFCVFLICAIKSIMHRTKVLSHKKRYHYQISNYYLLTNETNFGTVEMSVFLQDDDFISFISSDGRLFSTVTHFSNNQFECQGSCFCEYSAERRFASISTVTKTASLIISAISVTLAVKVAEEYFQSRCESTRKQECPEEIPITSKVICDPSESHSEWYDYLETSERERLYFCEGHCWPSMYMKREESIYARKKFNCRNKELSGMISVDFSSTIGSVSYGKNEYARRVFLKRKLTPFCKSISQYKYSFKYTNPTTMKNWAKTYQVSLCSAKNNWSKGGLTNVKCRLEFTFDYTKNPIIDYP